ncbi:MAG TPA: ComEC/Rec2 family competence protein, partial [Chloroflexota bacterium]
DSLGSAPALLGLSGAAVGAAILVRKLAFARLVGAIVLLATAALAAQVGAWRMQATLDHMADAKTQVTRFGGAQQQIRGLVADDPAPRGRTTSLTLSDVLVRNGDSWEPLGAKVLVSVPHWPDHEYGEYLQLRGRLQALSGAGAIEALGRQGVLASMSYLRVSWLANPQANPVLVGMSRLRQRLGDTIGQTLPDPVAATLKATILGLRGALPKNEQQALVNTGTVHLVVISGFKLSLLAAGLQMIGLWILRRTSARLFARLVVSASVLAGIGGYTVLTGATPSAVRAAIMAGLVVFAALMGRPHDQVAALAIAVLAIVGLSPLEVQDAGLQLSCLSVLGIAVLAEPLARWFRGPAARLPAAGWWGRLGRMAALALAEAMGASLAATAFDVPVLADSFHVVSLISPVANLLGMPLLAPIMIFGGLGAGLGSVWLPLGAVFLWPAWAFTTLLDWLVNWTAGLPWKPVVQETAKQARASKRLAWRRWLPARWPSEQ